MRPNLDTPIIDTDHVGFYARDTEAGPTFYRVRWNRRQTARYAEALIPPRDGQIRFDYRGQGPLHELTVGDRISTPSLLARFAEHGPYTACLFCHHPLIDDLPCALGVGRDCAAKHLGLGRVALEVIYHRHTPPPDGGQPGPARAHRHLRLVAAYGRVIEAA